MFATLAPLSGYLGRALKPRVVSTLACFLVAVAADGFSFSVTALDGSLSQGDLGSRAAIALAALLLPTATSFGPHCFLPFARVHLQTALILFRPALVFSRAFVLSFHY